MKLDTCGNCRACAKTVTNQFGFEGGNYLEKWVRRVKGFIMSIFF